MRGTRLSGFLALIGFVMAGALAAQQTRSVQLSQGKPGAPAVVTVPDEAIEAPAPVPAAAPAPEFPKRPAELPPRAPKVSCHGDQLTISADNSTLDAILFAVRGCTGAKIDVPGDASRVRSYEELGPGPVREVLDQLLSGTPYNYVIQSSEANPLKVETVLLSMRTDGGDGKPGSNPNAISTDIPLTAGRRAWKLMQKFDKPDPSTLNSDGLQVESEASTPAEEAAAAAAANPVDANAAPALADAAPAEAAAAPASAMTPVAPPIIEPNSNADPGKAVQDRISQMQQMFAQRQQMMQKQNQSQGQGSGPQ